MSLEDSGTVSYTSPDWLIGDGDDIRATRDSAAWVLAFSLGYGVCPAGCTGRTVWTFSVFDDGRVRYDGSKVSGLPGPIPVP